MKRFILAGCAVFLCGCGQAPPALAGGKPVSYWIEALSNREAKLRKEAVFKLGNVGPTDPRAFPAVVGALRDADAGVRREAIFALLKFGPAAKEAIPELAEIQKNDRDAKVRTNAAKALAKLQEGK